MLQQEQQDTNPLTCPASMITMQSVSGNDNLLILLIHYVLRKICKLWVVLNWWYL